MSVTCKRFKALPVQPPDQFEIRIDTETAKTLLDVLYNVAGADGSGKRWSRRAYMHELFEQLYQVLPEYRDRVTPSDMDRGVLGCIYFNDVPRPE